MTEEQKAHKEHEEMKRYEISNLCVLSDLCVFVVNITEKLVIQIGIFFVRGMWFDYTV